MRISVDKKKGSKAKTIKLWGENISKMAQCWMESVSGEGREHRNTSESFVNVGERKHSWVSEIINENYFRVGKWFIMLSWWVNLGMNHRRMTGRYLFSGTGGKVIELHYEALINRPYQFASVSSVCFSLLVPQNTQFAKTKSQTCYRVSEWITHQFLPSREKESLATWKRSTHILISFFTPLGDVYARFKH